MRKAGLFALMLTLLLTACGGEEERDPASELQAAYAGLAAATLEADITCHYDDETRTYTMLCDYTPESSTITVLAPADLAGISATMADGTLTLSYEDISLDAGSYSAAAVSPVAALPRLMEAAAGGYVSQQSVEDVEERPCLRLSCDLDGEDGTLYTTWFDQESLLPMRSEISVDGVVVYEVTWSRFEARAVQEDGGTQDGGAAAQNDETASQGGDAADAGSGGAPSQDAGTTGTGTDQAGQTGQDAAGAAEQDTTAAG